MAELPVLCGYEAAHSAELNPPYGVLHFKCFFQTRLFSIPSQGIGLGKRLQNDLFCVEWDVKPQVNNQSAEMLRVCVFACFLPECLLRIADTRRGVAIEVGHSVSVICRQFTGGLCSFWRLRHWCRH